MTQAVDLANAINTFVKGCKTDGTWDAIKACCIMAAWDGLDGALYPLKGTAPTNYNFVSGDYNRKTGLVGDGSTKYLDSNRLYNSDPQNNCSACVWHSSLDTGTTGITLGHNSSVTANTILFNNTALSAARHVDRLTSPSLGSQTTGFMGVSRASSVNYTGRLAGTNTVVTSASSAKGNFTTFVFAQNFNGSAASFTNARLAFYSIGEALDLALLDSRVTNLITAFGAAIP